VLGLTMQIVCLIVPLMVQFYIFEPCFDCYDFEGAAVHEIGHALGLGHPNTAREEVDQEFYSNYGTTGDNVYNAMLANDSALLGDSCLNPWHDVANNTPPDALVDERGCDRGYNDELITGCVGIRDSVMEAFTQNNPSVCLARDDLEAVQTLYPDCQVPIVEPVCYRVNLNLGFVRIAVYVMGPLLVILGLVVLMQSVISYHNREELREHKLELKAHKKQNVQNKFKLGAAAFAGANSRKSGSRTDSTDATPSVTVSAEVPGVVTGTSDGAGVGVGTSPQIASILAKSRAAAEQGNVQITRP